MSQSRFSPQINQERISRKQIEERLVNFGWVATPPEVDLGEDYFIHIYIGGRATGVSFYAQAKSVTNLLQRRKNNKLVYTLKPKDLKHWETFVLPVVVIVWDTKRREGCWALISKLISQLNKDRPNWRNNTTGVSVSIPWENTLDDVGLVSLKQAVGQHFYPLIAGDKELELNVKLSFPNTPEGQEFRGAFERHLKEGEPVDLKGKIIQELRFSPWWEQWFGGYDPETVELHIGPTSSSDTLLAGIDVISNAGENASISNIEFRYTQVGTELVKLTNDHQAVPLHFNVTLPKPEISRYGYISLTTKSFGRNVFETRDTMRFLQALTNGGKICLTFTSLNNQTLVVSL